MLVRGIYCEHACTMVCCKVDMMAHCAVNIVALLLLSASSVLGQGETAKITDGVYAFNLGAVELPYTSMFVVTGNGVMVIDPINSDSATALLQEIRKITDEPIKYVFYSHDHWDHTSGGQVFKNEEAEIIAHTDSNEWIKSNTGPYQIPLTVFGTEAENIIVLVNLLWNCMNLDQVMEME